MGITTKNFEDLIQLARDWHVYSIPAQGKEYEVYRIKSISSVWVHFYDDDDDFSVSFSRATRCGSLDVTCVGGTPKISYLMLADINNLQNIIDEYRAFLNELKGEG